MYNLSSTNWHEHTQVEKFALSTCVGKVGHKGQHDEKYYVCMYVCMYICMYVRM
jgi:hypothetical protein